MWTILIGGLAGFLAGQILRGEGYGILGNIILGLLGGVIGGFLFSIAGLGPTGLIGEIISRTVGAIILVYFFRKRRHGGRAENE